MKILALVHLLIEDDAHLSILLLPRAVRVPVVGHSSICGILLNFGFATEPASGFRLHLDDDLWVSGLSSDLVEGLLCGRSDSGNWLKNPLRAWFGRSWETVPVVRG